MQRHLHHSWELCELILEGANVQLEVIVCSHFYDKKVGVILLGLLAGSVMSEKRLGFFFQIIECT